MSIPKLKFLAKRHHIKVRGSLVEDWSGTYRKPPTKTQYINKLAKVLSEKDITSGLKKMPKVKTKKKADKPVLDTIQVSKAKITDVIAKGLGWVSKGKSIQTEVLIRFEKEGLKFGK